ncbi:sensor histidine kinase [Paenibacillus sp. GCM10023248]|uniref:sensor histidine kinase n=1 Tax=Bacillales TaxID=1385 RepID=UPI002378040B|nr:MULTISPECIES: histidine kinase [Bacillales]MDD9268992.1 histidine kinase [Paenibacillus sp. MAHUQ-63]MDR6885008.1 two-component system sensor histidine kinase YesM [Bacillus sp. 3255]
MFSKLRENARAYFYDRLTLKRRIFIIFLGSTLIPFLCIVLISYYTIYSILTNKIQNGIQSNLKQVELSLESTISNLNHVSQQLAFAGSVGKKLDQMLSLPAEQSFERSKMLSDLKDELSLVTFTNPNIGLTFYYFQKDHTIDLENMGVKDSFSPDTLPLLAAYSGISYYGPHISNNRFDNNFVLSALRKVDLPMRDDVYVYIETGFHLTQNILNNGQFGGGNYHVFLDNNGRIAYSELPQAFVKDTIFPNFSQDKTNGTQNEFYWFRQVSNQGWSIVSVIPKADYNKEMNQWFVQIGLFALLFLVISMLMAWLLWKMVYVPLNGFNREIKLMAQNRVQTVTVRTKIPEFDFLLNQFRQMKEQIWNLFAEVERKEKRRVDLEVEKLLYQINPHFLMNTLDTVHWLALMNGQTEIDKLVSSLNKLLHYNLGKLGAASTIQEEIEALKQYLTLQQIRYDFQFDVQMNVDEQVWSMPIPRFILQPLVENSLYHGLSDDGYIRVDVSLTHAIQISIRDNGAGMTEETIRKLLDQPDTENKKVGMGIGLNYVKRMLESQYGDKASLSIQSVLGHGTTIHVSIPIVEVLSPA